MTIEELRQELISRLEPAYFVGGFGGAILEVEEIRNAGPYELIEIAKRYGYDVEMEEEEEEEKEEEHPHHL